MKICVTLFAVLALFSCCTKPYAQFDYRVVCSELLLQHAIPHVTYTNKNGQTITMTLTPEYWKDGDGQDSDNYTYTYVTGADNSPRKHWQVPTMKFDDFTEANSEITVTYEPKPDVAPDSTVLLSGNLFHEVVYNVSVRDDDGDMHSMPDKNVHITSVNVTLPKRLNLVDHIKGLKDHYKIHTQSNGTIKVDL